MEYRCVTTSVEGFVQQLAVAYVTHGYWFYVAGEIPEGKDPAAVDAKLIDRYGIAISKWARCRRKKQGLANMQYMRHKRTFVLLATKGRHEFFERESGSIRDIRRVPIKFAGYSIGCRKGRDGRWHASVRIERRVQDAMMVQLLETGAWRCANRVESELMQFPYAVFAQVLRQLGMIGRVVNRNRVNAGLDLIKPLFLSRKRRIVRPFDHVALAISPRVGEIAAGGPTRSVATSRDDQLDANRATVPAFGASY